jgi:hypothetical protein
MRSFPVTLNIPLFERGAAGVPSASYFGIDLADRLERYEHAISDQFGFESAVVERNVSLAEALFALRFWLMRSTEVGAPDGANIFEGFVSQIDATFAQESRTLSLMPMANRIIVKYTTTDGGSAVLAPINNTVSQALYGIKLETQSFEATDSTDATNKANRILSELKNPQMSRRSQAATGQPPPLGAHLRCSFAGWYAALDWLTTANTTAAAAVTTTQVKTLLTAYNAVNAFFSTDQSQIAASGVSKPQLIPNDTSYRKAIEDLLSSGNSGGNALAWGVYENRVFQVAASAKATPDTITYRRYLADGRIIDSNNNVVPWWKVRPNAIYEVVDLLDPDPVSTQQDAAARSYIARVRFSASRDQLSLDLEGANGESIDKLLARVR